MCCRHSLKLEVAWMEPAQLLCTAPASTIRIDGSVFPLAEGRSERWGGRWAPPGISQHSHHRSGKTYSEDAVALASSSQTQIEFPGAESSSQPEPEWMYCSDIWAGHVLRSLAAGAPWKSPALGHSLAHCTRLYWFLCEVSRGPCCPVRYSPCALTGQLTFQAP